MSVRALNDGLNTEGSDVRRSEGCGDAGMEVCGDAGMEVCEALSLPVQVLRIIRDSQFEF
jgi:hypothetical protein